MKGTETAATRQRELLAAHLVRALSHSKILRAHVKSLAPRSAARCVLFAVPLVRAILDGRKTETRRLVTPQPVAAPPDVCPLGRPADPLRVREKWGFRNQFYERDAVGVAPYVYAADGPPAGSKFQPWRTSLHMPREAGRMVLEISDVRAERLTCVSGKDALAEGCPEDRRHEPIAWFKEVWDRYYAARGLGWSANPWVWVIEFKVPPQV